MDDQLDFQWNDIHQLDKMFSMATSGDADGSHGQNEDQDQDQDQDHGAADDGSTGNGSSTPDSHGHKHALPSGRESTAAADRNDRHPGSAATTATTSNLNPNLTDSTTPSSANNDYMLFLNLATPNSGIDDADGGPARSRDKDKERERDAAGRHSTNDWGKDSDLDHRPPTGSAEIGDGDPNGAGAFGRFSFDNMEASHLGYIVDQRHQHPQQQLLYSAVPNPQPPSTQTRSRINSVEFTPLLSPMINPSLERVNSNKGKSGFSPLSSPVLEFQKYNNTTSLRQKRKDPHDAHAASSSVKANSANSTYSDQPSGNGSGADQSGNLSLKFENSDARSYKRSKTPVSTPLLSTMDRKSKVSSNRNSSSTGSSTQTTPYQTYVFKQQQFPPSKENSMTLKPTSISASSNMDYPGNSFLDAFDGELTLPPPPTAGGKGLISENDGFVIPSAAFNSNITGNHNDNNELTMALNSASTIFNSSSANHSKKNSVLLNPNHHKSAQSSPVILPSSSIVLGSPRMEPKSLNARSSHASSASSSFRPTINTSKFANSSSSSLNTISNLSSSNVSAVGTNILGTPQINSLPTIPPSHSEDDGAETRSGSNAGNISNGEYQHHHHHYHHSDKKMSHKLAEQGRRNRMNIAIQDLEKMIPESMKRNITVPSKATTVELGCRYIQDLLHQLQNVKDGSSDGSFGVGEKLVKTESISPLDHLENSSNHLHHHHQHNSTNNNNNDFSDSSV